MQENNGPALMGRVGTTAVPAFPLPQEPLTTLKRTRVPTLPIARPPNPNPTPALFTTSNSWSPTWHLGHVWAPNWRPGFPIWHEFRHPVVIGVPL
eukprot:3906508-Karenia_brevis.AAC.1